MELEATIDELAPRLLAYCHGLTRDRALAEDGAQDALAALVRRWRSGGKPQSPAAFVFAIARRRAIRALAKQRLLAPFFGTAAETLVTDAGPASESRSEPARVLRAVSRELVRPSRDPASGPGAGGTEPARGCRTDPIVPTGRIAPGEPSVASCMRFLALASGVSLAWELSHAGE